MPSSILEIREELLAGTCRWLPYRTFTVCDPKRRLILAAPFRDRIVHQAIYQVLGPTLDALIPHNSFACRKGMGNHAAAQSLADILKKLGPDRWTIKLDVRQYFLSIDHKTLMTMLGPYMETPEVTALVRSLLASHPEYGMLERGLPIGNVSSQSFANLDLSPVDRLGASIDGVDYIRYMDDMVITGHHRKAVYSLAAEIRAMVHETLKLSIPYHKVVHLGSDPVPFLGYVIDHHGSRPLARNLRRHRRQIAAMQKAGVKESTLAKAEASFSAWKTMGKKQLYEISRNR